MNSKRYSILKNLCVFILLSLISGLPSSLASELVFSSVEADIMLVVDNSGSMKNNDPKFITKDVVSNLIENLNSASRLGMVIFDEGAKLVEPLTMTTLAKNRIRFFDNLDTIDYKGKFTNIPSGIERAIYELKNNGRSDVFKGIIFLTDGIVDTGNTSNDVEKKRWLKEELSKESALAGIRIFGIAFTENADIQLIQTLSLKTKASYFRAYTAEDIPPVFTTIFEIIHDSKALPKDITPIVDGTSALPSKPLDVVVKKTSGEVVKTPEATPPTVTAPITKNTATARRSFLGSFFLGLFALVAAAIIGIISYLWFFHKTYFKAYLEKISSLTDSRQSDREINPLAFPEAKLVDVNQVFKREPVNLNLDKSRVTVGRDLNNDIVLSKKTVSSFHATIEYRDGYYFIEDHRSTNGTVLNNRSLDKNNPIQLKSGDRISFADCEFSFIVVDQIPAGDTILLESYTLSLNDQQALRDRIGGGKGEDDDELDDAVLFKQCVANHLEKVGGLGSAHHVFVEEYFTDEVIDSLADLVKDIMPHTRIDVCGHSSTLLRPPILYQICILPYSIDEAKGWFLEKYQGFTNFLKHTISSTHFKESGCKTLCYITYGKKEDIWVSFTIIPVDKSVHAVEIMSVEFLTEDEKHALSLEFGTLGQILYDGDALIKETADIGSEEEKDSSL